MVLYKKQRINLTHCNKNNFLKLIFSKILLKILSYFTKFEVVSVISKFV